jgi:hypothetical protein
VWFDPGSSGAPWRAELLDPRWARAPFFELCQNPDLTTCPIATDPPAFRAVIEGGTLSVAFHNPADDDQAGDDAVFIGIGSPGVANAVAAKILLDTSTDPIDVPTGVPADPTPPAPNAAFTVSWSSASNASSAANWSPLTLGMPTWLNSVASWRSPPGAPQGAWAITFKVDLAALGYTVPISTRVQLFLGTRYEGSNGTPLSLPNVTSDTVAGAETNIPASKTSPGWIDFTSPLPGCAGGITLR